MQLAHGIGQGLLEPVVRGLGLLRAGAVPGAAARSKSTLSGARAPSRAASSAAVSTAHAYGAAVLASSQRATSCGAAASVWVNP